MPISTEGSKHIVNGKEVTLYPISVLCTKLSKALGDERTPQTIRKWEKAKIIPPATFRVGNKRLYHMEQINTICRVAKECGIKQGVSLSLTNFSVRVWEELRKVNKKLIGK